MNNIESKLNTSPSDDKTPLTEWDTLMDEVPFPNDISETIGQELSQEKND